MKDRASYSAEEKLAIVKMVLSRKHSIQDVAKEKGILTVGVVTIPFMFEGKVRMGKALLGVEEMRKNVDALLVINNQRLFDIYADGMTTVEQAFAKTDEIVTVAAKSISEIITMEGIVNRDFCDVQTVMKDGGNAIMSVGRANGENRIEKAFVDALKSPLLNNVEIEKARRMLYIIYSSDEHQVTISELSEINMFMDDLAEDIEVLWGLYRDNSLGEDVKVALIATDFEQDNSSESSKSEENEFSQKEALIRNYYGNTSKKEQKKVEVKVEEKVEEPLVTVEIPTPVEVSEPQQVVTEIEEPKPTAKVTFLNRFMKKLGEFVDGVE